MSRRSKYVVLSDSEEDENVEDDNLFGTPPSSPGRSFGLLSLNVTSPERATEKKPRSLARTGAKKAVRQVHHLKSRVSEMRGKQLSPVYSFLMSEWTFEFDDDQQQVLSSLEPYDNVAIMLQRVKHVYNLFKASFDHVSGIYIGKSTNLRVRHSHHMRSKKKLDESLAMIGIGLFTDNEVHPVDRTRWGMTCETIGFQYERLLTQAVVDDGLPTYNESQEPGGGGRSGGANVKECVVYMLLSFK